MGNKSKWSHQQGRRLMSTVAVGTLALGGSALAVPSADPPGALRTVSAQVLLVDYASPCSIKIGRAHV